MYPFGNTMEGYYPPQGPTEITDLSVGDTVIPGTNIVNDNKIRKVPILYHPEYLVDYIKDERFYDLLDALMTGTVKTPIGRITSDTVSRSGIAQEFNGPGILAVKDGKLTVTPPGTFVYGFKTPYVFGIKTKDGLEIKEGKNTLDVVSYDQISNDTIPHDYVSANSVKKWFKGAKIGESITLDYAIANFNDRRNLVTPENIKLFFGDSVATYMKNYSSGLPILAYIGPVTEKVIGNGGDSLGSYPQYNDANREHNARAFVKAWDGTIIPPHTISSGKETVGFESCPDPHAPKGVASHGACPPARALRGAVTAAGFGLPTGLTWEEYTVQFGFNPAVDVKVTNTRDYPVKIVMWTNGAGPGMSIHAKLIALMPQ